MDILIGYIALFQTKKPGNCKILLSQPEQVLDPVALDEAGEGHLLVQLHEG